MFIPPLVREARRQQALQFATQRYAPMSEHIRQLRQLTRAQAAADVDIEAVLVALESDVRQAIERDVFASVLRWNGTGGVKYDPRLTYDAQGREVVPAAASSSSAAAAAAASSVVAKFLPPVRPATKRRIVVSDSSSSSDSSEDDGELLVSPRDHVMKDASSSSSSSSTIFYVSVSVAFQNVKGGQKALAIFRADFPSRRAWLDYENSGTGDPHYKAHIGAQLEDFEVAHAAAWFIVEKSETLQGSDKGVGPFVQLTTGRYVSRLPLTMVASLQAPSKPVAVGGADCTHAQWHCRRKQNSFTSNEWQDWTWQCKFCLRDGTGKAPLSLADEAYRRSILVAGSNSTVGDVEDAAARYKQ